MALMIRTIIAKEVINTLKRYMKHTHEKNKVGIEVAILVIAIKYNVSSELEKVA